MPGGRTIRIDGKKYEVIKHEIDTIEIEKTKIVTKKGADIVHEVIDAITTEPLDTFPSLPLTITGIFQS